MNELSHLTLHSTLADLPTSDFKVDEQTFGEEIETAFHQNPDLPGVMVTARDRIVGILPRGKFFEWIGRRYGIELYLKRPIRVLLDATIQELNDRLELDVYPTRCLLLSHQSTIEQAVEIALSRPTFLAYEPIVVAGVDREWRLLDMYVLLRAQSRLFELGQERFPGKHESRTAHAAQFHPRLYPNYESRYRTTWESPTTSGDYFSGGGASARLNRRCSGYVEN